MMKKTIISLMLMLLSTAPISRAAESDTRQLVELPAPMRQHMLGNMRDHLLAIMAIQDALGAGAFDRAADTAETRIGMSSLAAHGAAHMAPYMPKQMQDIGTQMHRAASQFAVIAQENSADGDLKKSIGYLSKITQQCVACHAAYRTQ